MKTSSKAANQPAGEKAAAKYQQATAENNGASARKLKMKISISGAGSVSISAEMKMKSMVKAANEESENSK
jgi:hypothetical protein